MTLRIDQLMIYTNLMKNKAIKNLYLMDKTDDVEEKVKFYYKIHRDIIKDCSSDILGWKEYIMELILHDENKFSLHCEKGHSPEEVLLDIAREDLKIIKDLYFFDWYLCMHDISSKVLIQHDKLSDKNNSMHNAMKNNSIEEFTTKIIDYYKVHGVGVFSDNYVFKWNDGFKTIENFDSVEFNDLIGYEYQIKALKDNTLSFIKKGKGNNVLLYGDRGTGKSSSVKALVQEYKFMGLRMIEVKKHQFNDLQSIIDIIRNRNYKFIIFIDDLSFEEFETDYKVFKGILEGSFEKRPDNVLIYVTSNRRHMIRESFKERDDDVHSNETMQEKLSLFDRFGISILFNQPKDDLYNEMVIQLARRNGIKLPETELLNLANQWRVTKASKSGRTAQQLIEFLRISE